MHYEGDIYRPPSEAYSLIVQVTVGCTHNGCTFCPNYKSKKFRIKHFDIVHNDLLQARSYNSYIERVFFADGDVFCMETDELIRLLDDVRTLFPECKRVGAYSRASQILSKSNNELQRLKEAGLGILYIGAESGSDEVLRRVNKGESAAQITEAVQKAEENGVIASVTFISGLGGRELREEHAVKTGEMISAMGASYVGLLTLMLSPETPLYEDVLTGKFVQLTPLESVGELEMIIEHTDCSKDTILRSNHASNWLELKGTLPQDKERLLNQIRSAKSDPSVLKPRYLRRL